MLGKGRAAKADGMAARRSPSHPPWDGTDVAYHLICQEPEEGPAQGVAQRPNHCWEAQPGLVLSPLVPEGLQ